MEHLTLSSTPPPSPNPLPLPPLHPTPPREEINEHHERAATIAVFQGQIRRGIASLKEGADVIRRGITSLKEGSDVPQQHQKSDRGGHGQSHDSHMPVLILQF